MKTTTTLSFLKSVAITLVLVALGGCVADVSGSHEIELAFIPTVRVVDYSVWSELENGCDGALASLFADNTAACEVIFARAEGDETMGVILHGGVALCVDTWEVLEREAELLDVNLDHVKGDPSPDPMLPGEDPR